jgi:hypothetical protein
MCGPQNYIGKRLFLSPNEELNEVECKMCSIRNDISKILMQSFDSLRKHVSKMKNLRSLNQFNL